MAQILSAEKIQELYEKAIEMLSAFGVAFDTPRALETFAAHGFKIENGRVFMDNSQVEPALKLVATGDYSDLSHRRVTATSPFGNVPVLYDSDIAAYRRPNVDDAVLMYQLIQTSDLYECTNPGIVEPLGLTGDCTYLSQLSLLLKYSDKWFSNGMRATARNARGGNMYEAERELIQLVKHLRGVSDEVVMGQGICPMSPLRYDSECLANLTAAVDEGQSITLFPCSLTGMTGPGGLIDQVLHDIALSMAGIVYVTMLNPAVEVALSPCSGVSDMRAVQAAYGTSESMYLSMMFYEFCKYYKLNCAVCATMADAARPDFQAGFESGLTTMLPYILSDIDVLWAYPGHMAAWYCGSFEKVIYDEEIIRNVNRALKGTCTDISPKLMDSMPKAIEKNTFMTGRTPKEYRRDHYLSQIFSKYGVAEDLDKSKTDIRLRAKAEIQRRVESYQLPDWTEDQKKLLNHYLPEGYKF